MLKENLHSYSRSWQDPPVCTLTAVRLRGRWKMVYNWEMCDKVSISTTCTYVTDNLWCDEHYSYLPCLVGRPHSMWWSSTPLYLSWMFMHTCQRRRWLAYWEVNTAVRRVSCMWRRPSPVTASVQACSVRWTQVRHCLLVVVLVERKWMKTFTLHHRFMLI